MKKLDYFDCFTKKDGESYYTFKHQIDEARDTYTYLYQPDFQTVMNDRFHVVKIYETSRAKTFYYLFEKDLNKKDCWQLICEKHRESYDDSDFDIEVVERNGCFSIEEFVWKERLQEEEHQEFVESLKIKSRQELSELILKYTEILNNDNYEYESWQDAYSFSERLIAIANEIKECIRFE